MITISLRSLDHNPVSLGLASMPWPCLSLIYYHKDYNITKIAGLRASLSGPHPHVMASPIFVIYYCRKDYNIAGIAWLWAGLSKPQPYTMDSLLIVKRITISLRSLDYDSVSLGLTPMPLLLIIFNCWENYNITRIAWLRACPFGPHPYAMAYHLIDILKTWKQ